MIKTLAITLLAVTIAISTLAFAGDLPPAIPTDLDLNLLNPNGSNIDTSLLLTINYLDSDSNPQSKNSVNNSGNGGNGTVFWGIYLGKSNLYNLLSAKDGTDINITVDGYETLVIIADAGGYIGGDYNLTKPVIVITSPTNDTIADTTLDLHFTISETANTTYNWDDEGNISGCRLCTSYNATYGENNGSDTNLSLLLHMNENTGTTAYDDVSNNNGTLGNATGGTQPNWTTGKFGPALEFDSVNDFVNVSDSPSLDFTDSLTMTAWVYPRFTSWPGYTGVVSKDATYALGMLAGKLRLSVHNGTQWSNTDSPDNVPLDQWVHIAGTFNGTWTRLYINGVEVKSQAVSAGWGSSITTTGYPLQVGYYTGQTYFNGTIDEVAIYNRTLSVAEIQELYTKALSIEQHSVTVYAVDNASNSNSETRWFTTVLSVDITSPPNATISDITPDLNFTVNAPANTTYNWDGEGNISGCRNCDTYNTIYGENNGSDPNTVLLMHMNEGTGTTAYDDASNNDGAINSATWGAGKFGLALDFNGTSGYVQVTDDASIDFNASTDSFTITTWINSIGATGTGQYIANKQSGLGYNPGYHLFILNSNGALRFMVHTTAGSGNYGNIQGTTNLIGTGWHHVAAVYDASADTMDIYVDGNNDTATASYTPTASSLNNEPLVIGAYNAASGKYVNGTLDEVVFYNRSLIQSEIQELYNKTLSATQHSVTVYATDADTNQDSATRYFTIG